MDIVHRGVQLQKYCQEVYSKAFYVISDALYGGLSFVTKAPYSFMLWQLNDMDGILLLV